MKKILIGLFLLATSTTFATEIIPELYLMEGLLLSLQSADTYINEETGEEVKAIRVDANVMSSLQTTENPFYVYDSTTKEKIVRKGDYFTAPTRLSSIQAISKDEFEEKYRNKFGNKKEFVKEQEEEEIQRINPEDVDEGSMDIEE